MKVSFNKPMKVLKTIHFLILVVLISLSQVGCDGREEVATTDAESHHHEHHYHEPPHGGAGVTLGDEDAHIEFLADPEVGTFTAWFYAPHMARYLRIKAESFEVVARLPNGEARLTFHAVANAGTGEIIGDTSQFLAKADWLTDVKSFDALLPEVTVGDTVYRNVEFNYPKGERHEH